MEVVIPYQPRPLQLEIHNLIDTHRFGSVVCHRRFGKTVKAINHLIKGAAKCNKERPRFGYIAPTYRQAKAIAWDYLKHYAGVIPGFEKNEVELYIRLPGDRQVRLYGADNPDSLRGIYLDGVVLDEYGLMTSNIFSEVIRPALSDRLGWALFLGTPNGKNQFWDICEIAKTEPGWFFREFKASQTGLLLPEELEAARKVMTAEEYAQEYECSFEASVKGAIYGKELSAAKDEGRICNVPHEPLLPVKTLWDLGIGDATAIWFYQQVRNEIRFIDYYESSGESLAHYIQYLQRKPYTYGDHWAPHDIQVRELTSGKSRLDTAASMGVKFKVAPNIGIEDGINAVRLMLPKCWFDQVKCKPGLEALQNYRRDYNQRLNEYKAVPVHDWASHGSDAFRIGAVAIKDIEEKAKHVELPVYHGEGGWMS